MTGHHHHHHQQQHCSHISPSLTAGCQTGRARTTPSSDHLQHRRPTTGKGKLAYYTTERGGCSSACLGRKPVAGEVCDAWPVRRQTYGYLPSRRAYTKQQCRRYTAVSSMPHCYQNLHMGWNMPHGITQCYLPPGRGDIPAFTPAEAGIRFSDPRGMQG